jgi:hypothetical protein
MQENFGAVLIPELAHGDDCVRIDWIGDPKAQANKQDRKAFQVEILVSVCDSSRLHNIKSGIPQRLVAISVDALPGLWIGSLWKNGRRLRTPGYLKTRPAKIEFVFGPEMWVSMSGTQNASGEMEYPIPKGEIPILRKSVVGAKSFWPSIKNSQLLSVCWGTDNPNVLIPAIEIARFYACISSALARNLIAGGWPALEYKPHSSSGVVDGRAKIGVDNIQHMDTLSGVAIARYKFSPGMRQQVDRAGQYLSLSSSRQSFFRFDFPFDRAGDKVKIVCDVVDFQKWNAQSESHETHYLVTQIKTCYQPLPFTELEVEFKVSAEKRAVENRGSLPQIHMGSKASPGSGSPTAPADSPKAPPQDPTSLAISPEMPNAIGEVTPFIDRQDRFAALNYKNVRLVSTKQEQKFRAARKPKRENGIAEGTSTNPGKGSKGDTTEGQIKTNPNEPTHREPVTLKAFQEALKALRKDAEFAMFVNEVSTQLRKPDLQLQFENVYVVPIRKLSKRPSPWHGTSLERAQAAKSRSRYLLIARVLFRNGAEYLIAEIERVKSSDKYSIFCAKLDTQVTQSADDIAIAVATEVAKRRGWPSLDLDQSTYTIDKMKLTARRLIHRGDLHDGKNYARRIVSLEYSVSKSGKA